MDFEIKHIPLFNLLFSSGNLLSNAQRSISQENPLNEQKQNPETLLFQKGLNNSFTLIENNFSFLRKRIFNSLTQGNSAIRPEGRKNKL